LVNYVIVEGRRRSMMKDKDEDEAEGIDSELDDLK
jgi:hypothetical protein